MSVSSVKQIVSFAIIKSTLQISSILRQPGCLVCADKTRCFPSPLHNRGFGFVEISVKKLLNTLQ